MAFRERLAIIDIGTVSSRLMLAEATDGGIAVRDKRTLITDLGQGVDAAGAFTGEAVERVIEACRSFRAAIDEFGPCATSLTLTSAARDAANADELLLPLEEMDFEPQIIGGEVEAALTFYGVAHDFEGSRIVVADSGGGSTELVLGGYVPGEKLALERAVSFDVGCRRLTERFLDAVPPSNADLECAARFARDEFSAYWDVVELKPKRLVVVGGTVTTLAAMARRMDAYDSSLIHLSTLSAGQVEGAIALLSTLETEEIASLPGIQPKRAPVILAGALIIRELMRGGGYSELTISESSLMAGMAATMVEVLRGRDATIGWKPHLTW